ncbi:hypothetical protein SLS57_004001 [Botryosphaeria dothidea]
MELPSVALYAPTMHRSDTIAIAKLAQAGRSTTLAAPFNLKETRDSSKRSHLSLPGHKHHHHSHHHRHHHHSSRSSKYGGDEKEIKSAVLPTSRPSFPDVVKPTNNASGSTSGASGSGNDAKDLVSSSVVAEYDASVRHVSSRVVRPEDVVKERTRQKRREEQLRNALHALSEQSMTTTRRLDDTYYSILEKVSGLHNTIDGLQELSMLTKKLGDEFTSDADELVDEVNNSLDSIGDFESQARLLEEFEARIVTGKEKAARLNERLEAARKRVDERERLEEEWRTSVNRRLRIFWSVLAGLAAFLLIVYIAYGIRTQKRAGPVSNGNSSEANNHSISLENDVPPSIRQILESVHSTSASTSPPPPLASNPTSDDERLHVFDEL